MFGDQVARLRSVVQVSLTKIASGQSVAFLYTIFITQSEVESVGWGLRSRRLQWIDKREQIDVK